MFAIFMFLAMTLIVGLCVLESYFVEDVDEDSEEYIDLKNKMDKLHSDSEEMKSLARLALLVDELDKEEKMEKYHEVK
jgi:ubiquitin C-terminal hydrolase